MRPDSYWELENLVSFIEREEHPTDTILLNREWLAAILNRAIEDLERVP